MIRICAASSPRYIVITRIKPDHSQRIFISPKPVKRVRSITSDDSGYVRDLNWVVSCAVNGTVLADFLGSPKIIELLNRVHAGHHLDEDNHVLGFDAQCAYIELDKAIVDLNGSAAKIWPVGEWLFANHQLTDHWEHQTLSIAASELELKSYAPRILLAGDIRDCLLDRAEYQFYVQPKTLNRDHVDTLRIWGRITVEEVEEWIAVQSAERFR